MTNQEVFHVDQFVDFSDNKLKFEQGLCIQTIKRMLENPCVDTEDLSVVVDLCKYYTDAIKARQSNYERQAKLAQLNLDYD